MSQSTKLTEVINKRKENLLKLIKKNDKRVKQIPAISNDIEEQDYKKLLNLTSYNNKKIRALESKLFVNLSNKQRLVTNVNDITTLDVNPSEYNCTIFRAEFEGTTAIYGFLYSKLSKDKLDFKYAALGGTFTSQDGEYRGNFISEPDVVVSSIRQNYPEVYDEIEAYVVDKINNEKLALHVDMFYSYECESESAVRSGVNESRMAIHLYILTWIFSFHHIHHKTIQNHINPAFQYIFYDKEDLPLYESIAEKIEDYESFMGETIHSRVKKNMPKKLLPREYSLGQKLFSLTRVESNNIYDITSDIWLEYYLMKKTTELICNSAATQFSVAGPITFIQNANSKLYDNKSQHEKYALSRKAMDISRQLGIVESSVYKNNARLGAVQIASGKFKYISQEIKDSIAYAENNIVISDVALVITSEYVGRTFRDIPSLIEAATEFPDKNYDLIDKTFDTYKYFHRYMFDILYGLHALNVRVGAIHGDLHINNATLFPFLPQIDNNDTGYRIYPRPSDKMQEVFVIGEPSESSPEAYILPFYGNIPCLIDFSRSIICSRSLLKNDFGDSYINRFLSVQGDSLFTLLSNQFADVIKKYGEEKIRYVISEKLDKLFKVISAIDIIMFTRGLLRMFKFESGMTISPEVVDLTQRVNNSAEDLFRSNLQKVMNDNATAESIPFANIELIREFYGKYEFDNNTDTTDLIITDIISLNAPIKYSPFDINKGMILSNTEIILNRAYNSVFDTIPISDKLFEAHKRKRAEDVQNGIERLAEYRKDMIVEPEDE